MLGIFALIAAASATQVAVQADHPAVKIIALLQKLQAQVKEEGEAETNSYGKFTYWCQEVIKENEGIVKKSSAEIAVAESSIKALTEDIAALEAEITELEAEITKDTAAKANGETLRGEANTLYGTNKADLEATIQAVADAITALESSKPSMAQTKMVQKALAYVDTYAPAKGKKVHAFLQARRQDPADEFENRKGRERTYDFKGGDIIETLKNLKLSFEDDLVELNKAETASANAHSLADAAKEDEINAATTAKESKTKIKGQKGEDLSSAQSDLDSATETKTTASTELEETKTKCRTRADEFDQRQATRKGEMAAMAQAVEVLEKITGVRTPESKGITTSLLQISKKVEDPKMQIVNLLRKAGNTKRTEALAKLADKIAALKQTPGSGVFDQIKNMIQKMIFHLMSEQKDEDDHKNWCDKEIDQTTKMKADKEDRKEELETSMAQLSAEIEELSTSIKDNSVFVADMESQIEQATTQRQEEKAENTATITDATEAQTAVSQAIAVLEDFYKSSGEVAKESWEFVQRKAVVRRARAEPEPELWGEGEAYTGTSGGSDVIGLLTNIATDFASMEAEARADETTQQNEYDEWLTGTKIDISQKQKDSEMKEARKSRMSEKLEAKTADNAHNQKELDATVQYEKDLQHACVDGDSTYADRKAARTQEITALKEAQKILEDAFKEAPAEE